MLHATDAHEVDYLTNTLVFTRRASLLKLECLCLDCCTKLGEIPLGYLQRSVHV